MFRGRESITPMEFEYNDGRGPVDASSPFAHVVGAKKRKSGTFASDDAPAWKRTKSLMFGTPGPHAVIESPSKNGFATPNRLQLREPNSQQYLFSNKPLPATPSYVQKSSAWAPRTPHSEIDFSSGGETPHTPAQESEAATPDTQLVNGMMALTSGGHERKSPKKERQPSRFKSLFGLSPSPAKEDRKPYSKKAENRVMKRRSKTRQLAIQDGFESNDEQQELSQRNPHPQQFQSQRPSQPGQKAGYAENAGHLLSWLEVHPRLPGVLLHWLQLSLNAILAFAFLYISWKVLSSIQADVDIESQKYVSEVMVDIADCARQFRENKCDMSTRLPALQTVCANWEACMQRDPKAIAKAKVGATTWAKIINAFVEEISWKSMVIIAFLFVTWLHLLPRMLREWLSSHGPVTHMVSPEPIHQHDPNPNPNPNPPPQFPRGFAAPMTAETDTDTDWCTC
jgi:hypothetical protein